MHIPFYTTYMGWSRARGAAPPEEDVTAVIKAALGESDWQKLEAPTFDNAFRLLRLSEMYSTSRAENWHDLGSDLAILMTLLAVGGVAAYRFGAKWHLPEALGVTGVGCGIGAFAASRRRDQRITEAAAVRYLRWTVDPNEKPFKEVATAMDHPDWRPKSPWPQKMQAIYAARGF